SAHSRPGTHQVPDELAWLDSHGLPYAVLGTPTTTAQVHPAKFTQVLLHAARARGAELRLGCVEGLEVVHGQVRGVRVDDQLLPAKVVVIAMGPWSGMLAPELSLPPVWGLKGHSITLQPPTPIPAQALFVDYVTTTGEHLAPEVYPRSDGEVYLCGLSEEIAPPATASAEGAQLNGLPFPESPELVQPRPDAGPLLQQIAATLSSSLA